MKILIDNGHGSNTAGKCSPLWKDGTQLFEWQHNRIIARRLYDKLTSLGYNAELIVPEEHDISLSERVKRVNEACKNEKCIFISIHCNAAGGHGWEVWTTTRKNNSDKLAKCFLDVFPKVFPDKELRGAKERNYTVIDGTNCPSVLTENFFMDTEDECHWLMTDDAINRIVELHVLAIKKYHDHLFPSKTL